VIAKNVQHTACGVQRGKGKKGTGSKTGMIQWYLTLKKVDKLSVQVIVTGVKSTGARMREDKKEGATGTNSERS